MDEALTTRWAQQLARFPVRRGMDHTAPTFHVRDLAPFAGIARAARSWLRCDRAPRSTEVGHGWPQLASGWSLMAATRFSRYYQTYHRRLPPRAPLTRDRGTLLRVRSSPNGSISAISMTVA
jgi:hypothetical protein